MPPPDPFAGTDEYFTPFSNGPDGKSGWLERVKNWHAAGNSSFSTTVAEASLVGYCNEIQELAAIRYFLGYCAIGSTSPYNLLRSNPVPHPKYPNLYCVGVTCSPFIPDSTSQGGRHSKPFVGAASNHRIEEI